MIVVLAVIGGLFLIYFAWQKWLLFSTTSTSDLLIAKVRLDTKVASHYVSEMEPVIRNFMKWIFLIALDQYSIRPPKRIIEAKLLAAGFSSQWAKFGSTTVLRLWERYDFADIARSTKALL